MVTGMPAASRRRSASTVRRRASSCRWRAAARSGLARSAVVVIVGGEVFEAADDLFEVAENDAVVVDETLASVGFGGVDEPTGLVYLAAVGGQELDCGLEVGAGQTLRWGAGSPAGAAVRRS